jgi:hypothetical protein
MKINEIIKLKLSERVCFVGEKKAVSRYQNQSVLNDFK